MCQFRGGELGTCERERVPGGEVADVLHATADIAMFNLLVGGNKCPELSRKKNLVISRTVKLNTDVC